MARYPNLVCARCDAAAVSLAATALTITVSCVLFMYATDPLHVNAIGPLSYICHWPPFTALMLPGVSA